MATHVVALLDELGSRPIPWIVGKAEASAIQTAATTLEQLERRLAQVIEENDRLAAHAAGLREILLTYNKRRADPPEPKNAPSGFGLLDIGGSCP